MIASTMNRDTTPMVRIAARDYERLISLAEAARNSSPEVGDYLMGELDRAMVVNSVGRDTVCMGSTLTYRDESDGSERTVQLVYPAEANLSSGRISVITPIGAALIGLSAGDSIVWRTRLGRQKVLTVIAVGKGELAAS